MRIITTISNNELYEKLKEEYGNEVYSIDIENTLSVIKDKNETVVIVKISNEKEIDNIKRIKVENKNNKVIVLVSKLTDNLKSKLFSIEVFNIIEGSEIDTKDIIHSINSPALVIYKAKKKVRKSNVIFVTGFESSGKTFIANILACKISKFKKKTLVIDLNLDCPTLDFLVKESKNYSLLDYIKDSEKNEYKVMSNYETSCSKNKHLKYILNNKKIDSLDNEVITNMIKRASAFYDYIIVDTSSRNIEQTYALSYKLNGYIIFVVNENNKFLRKYKSIVNKVEKSNVIFLKNNINRDKKIEKIKCMCNVTFKIFSHVHICGINKLYSKIGIIRLEKIKMKILGKLLELEEE